MTYDQIFALSPQELMTWLQNQFHIDLPSRIESTEDMSTASQLLLILTGHHTYLAELLSVAKLEVRRAKRELTKEEWEDMVDRKEMIERRLDIAKQQYNAVSRAVSVKVEANRELQMGRSI